MRKTPFFSIIILLFILFLSFFGNFIYTTSANDLSALNILLPPSLEHPFGTDRLGRDLLARVMQGGRVSFIIGVGSALIATMVGLMAGATAGFLQGKIDKLFVITVDLFLTFPTFFLLLALVSYVKASVFVLIIVISITGWMTTARLIRSQSFEISNQSFIKILKIAKVSRLKILLKYYLPLLAPLFLISFTFGVGGSILAESGLSFLGLGISSPQISWGTILSEGKEVLDIAWWVSFFPGLMIFLVTLSFMSLSDYLQALTNKKEKNSI